jgi:UDP-glucose 4-epimerase
MKAIVFGGSGFIGSHVADELADRGHKVKIFDKKQSPYIQKNQEMVIGDILNENEVCRAVKGCDYVYNFAGLADLDTASTKPLETVKQNIMGNVHILNACLKEKPKRFVYASTTYVFSPLGGFYRCSKHAAELYVEEYNRKYGLEFTILRYGTVYGPRADERNSVHKYLKQALAEGKIACAGTGKEVREYIHVRDVAKLSVDILSGEYKNEHVIITGHHPVKFEDMLNTINEIFGNKLKIEFTAPPKDSNHYNLTPYSFIPRLGRKLVSNYYVDLGQGLLGCLSEMQAKKSK